MCILGSAKQLLMRTWGCREHLHVVLTDFQLALVQALSIMTSVLWKTPTTSSPIRTRTSCANLFSFQYDGHRDNRLS